MTFRTLTLLFIAMALAPEAAAYVVVHAGWAGLVLAALILLVIAGVIGALVCWRSIASASWTRSHATPVASADHSEVVADALRQISERAPQ